MPPEPDKMTPFSPRSQAVEQPPPAQPHPRSRHPLARCPRRLSRSAGAHPVCHGVLLRSAVAAGLRHPLVLAARGGCQPDRHRLHELGGAGIRLQMAVVTPGGSTAPAPALPAAGTAAQLDAALPGVDRPLPGRHGLLRSQDPARPARPVRPAGGFRLRHPGHRHRRLPYRVGARAVAGGHGRLLHDRVPTRHDHGRSGGAGAGRLARQQQRL